MQSNLVHKEEQRIVNFEKWAGFDCNKEFQRAIDTTSDRTILISQKKNFQRSSGTTVKCQNETISTGGIQYIKNDSIRKLVSSWDTWPARLKIQEAFLEPTVQKIEIYLMSN
jgi:hypothetical protein